jgi:hypothetical protein
MTLLDSTTTTQSFRSSSTRPELRLASSSRRINVFSRLSSSAVTHDGHLRHEILLLTRGGGGGNRRSGKASSSSRSTDGIASDEADDEAEQETSEDDDAEVEASEDQEGGVAVASILRTVVVQVLTVVWAIVASAWKIVSSVLYKLMMMTSSSSSADGDSSESTSNETSRTIAARLAELNISTTEQPSAIPNWLVVGGTLAAALKRAKQEARLLVALTTTTSRANEPALRALLSKQVIKVANKISKKVSPNGSFLIWIGDDLKSLSTAGATTISRDKLYVLAPNNGKILGQSVMPQSEKDGGAKLADYLADLRQRHKKLLLALSKRRQELMWERERRDGYSQSVVSDERRREEKRLQLQEEKAAAVAAATRAAEIIARRAVLQRELPEEPDDETTSIVVAIRLPDGRKFQRRFARDTATSVLFNWADVVCAHEREKIQLQTMNGSQTLTYDDSADETTLSGIAPGKKAIAFRVLFVES